MSEEIKKRRKPENKFCDNYFGNHIQRPCMGCKKVFTSTHNLNRFCNKCREKLNRLDAGSISDFYEIEQ